MKEVPYGRGATYDPEDTRALLRPAPARGRDDQVEPAEDHRAGHRLAVPNELKKELKADDGATARSWRALCRGRASGVSSAHVPASRRRAAAGDAAPADDDLDYRHLHVGRRRSSRKPCGAPKASPTCSISPDLARGWGSGSQHSRRATPISSTTFVASLIPRIDAGDPIVILAGLHVGCFELFGGRTRPHDPRPEGEDRRRERGRRSGPRLHREHAGVRRPGRPQRRPLGHAHRRSRSSGSPTARSMRSSASPPSAGAPGQAARAMSWSTARRTGRGPSTSAAWSPQTGTSSGSTLWRRSGRCGRF